MQQVRFYQLILCVLNKIRSTRKHDASHPSIHGSLRKANQGWSRPSLSDSYDDVLWILLTDTIKFGSRTRRMVDDC